MDPLLDFQGKVVWITGASRGIGKAAALAFAQRGAHVIVSSRKQDACQLVVDEIVGLGGNANAIACHMGDEQATTDALDQVYKQAGRLDVLVNNAATNPHFGRIIDCPASMFDKTISVNLRGPFLLSSAAAKRMGGDGGGNIVNISSINGARPAPGQGVYSITKAAVIHMTKAFARECGPLGVRVNAILPGLTDTKFAAALTENEALLGQLLPQIPLGRMAQPEEIVPSILMMAAPGGSYISGACLTVDGGFLA